jgi:hypothetical protein
MLTVVCQTRKMRLYAVCQIYCSSIRKIPLLFKKLNTSSIYWDITPCSPRRVNRRFGGTCHLNLHGRRISKSIKPARSRCCSVCHLLHSGFLLGLFFDPENGSDMLLRNIDCLSTNYLALYPKG